MRAKIATIKVTNEFVLIEDVGDWRVGPTITNDAEGVVKWLYSHDIIVNKRLFYYDSDGNICELVHENGRFVNFRDVLVKEVDMF